MAILVILNLREQRGSIGNLAQADRAHLCRICGAIEIIHTRIEFFVCPLNVFIDLGEGTV